MTTPRLIALDWGSTSARAYLMSDENEIVGQRQAPLGILNIKDRRFDGALLDLCGPWLLARRELPLIAAGMIGSRQGWAEAPYVTCPAGLSELSSHLKPVEIPNQRKLWIVPGVSMLTDDGTPDVMRGEETQIMGALNFAERERGSTLFILPGTHSKWVRVENGRIVWIRTYMTGELFSVLTRHSILGKLMPEGEQKSASDAIASAAATHAVVNGQLDAETKAAAATAAANAAVVAAANDDNAFERGVNRAHQDPFGLASLLFTARTLPLFDKLKPESIADYLSGLLIGHEIYTAERALNALQLHHESVRLVGEMALLRNYQRALTLLGWSSSVAPAQPAAAGIWRVANRSGLLGVQG
jgi:2-dehydro-3-deoxygalactonokinase